MEQRHGACYESSSKITQSGSWGMRVHDGSASLVVVMMVAVGLSLASVAPGLRRGTGNCVGNDACVVGKDWRGSSRSSGSVECSVVRRWISASSRR